MQKMNCTRLLIGALVVAIIAFLTDGYFHESVVRADWKAVFDGIRATPPEHSNTSFAYFAVFEIGRGLLTMLVYVTLRPFYKPGPKTAAMAGLISWFAFSLTGPAQFIPLGLYSNMLWIKVGAFQLVTSIVAAIAGAALYKDSATQAS